MLVVPREVCIDLDKALGFEWLVSNGQGSYAASTLTGTLTRRHHGLLVAALEPPRRRMTLLAKIDEEVEIAGHTYKLGTNEYQANIFNPDGYLYLQQVSFEGAIPTFAYGAARFQLAKTIWMEPAHTTTYIHYSLSESSERVQLTLLPFCDYRDANALTQGDESWRFRIEPLDRGFCVTAYDGAEPYRILTSMRVSFAPLELWYWRFHLRAEQAAGQAHTTDLFLPGLLRTTLEPGASLTVLATREADAAIDWDAAASLARAQRMMSTKRTSFGTDLFTAESLSLSYLSDAFAE